MEPAAPVEDGCDRRGKESLARQQGFWHKQLAAMTELKDPRGGGAAPGGGSRNEEFVFGRVLSDVPIRHPGEDAKWWLYV